MLGKGDSPAWQTYPKYDSHLLGMAGLIPDTPDNGTGIVGGLQCLKLSRAGTERQ